MTDTLYYLVKVLSRVKNHHFSKFSIFRLISRAHQELSFKKKSRKKCFFCAELWSAKVFSMLIILIDRWRVLSYLIRMPLLYSAHCFSLDFGSECLQRRKKSLSVFVLDSKTKEGDKIVLQSVGFEISRERQGLLLQSRKIAKKWQSFWKTYWNYLEIEFHEFVSERSELFRPRSGQACDKFATGPAPSDFFESLL